MLVSHAIHFSLREKGDTSTYVQVLFTPSTNFDSDFVSTSGKVLTPSDASMATSRRYLSKASTFVVGAPLALEKLGSENRPRMCVDSPVCYFITRVLSHDACVLLSPVGYGMGPPTRNAYEQPEQAVTIFW